MQDNRRTALALIVALIACLPLSGCITCSQGFSSRDCPFKPPPPPLTEGTLSDLAVSPDGNIVAFSFRDDLHHRHASGLFDRQTGKLARAGIDLPSPSFSPDGKSLAIAGGRVVDVAALWSGAPVPPGAPTIDGRSIFEPGTGAVLTVARGTQKDPLGQPLDTLTLHAQDGAVRDLLAPADEFGLIRDTAFVNKRWILFIGFMPLNPQYQAYERSLATQKYQRFLYMLPPGERPVPLDNIVFRDVGPAGASSRLQEFAVSADGTVMVFILRANTPSERNRAYYYEVFREDLGRLTQMTHAGGHPRDLAISGNGTTAVFGYDVPSSGDYDLAVLDMRSGATVKTGLLDRIKNDPQFQH